MDRRGTLAAFVLLLGAPDAGATITTTCTSQESCTLAELLAGAQITVDGDEFSNWNAPFNQIHQFIPDPFGGYSGVVGELDTQAIDVIPVDSDPLGPVLRFVGNGALDLTSDGSYRGYVLVIDFDLTTSDPVDPIEGASLALSSFTTTGDGTIELGLDGCPLGNSDCDEPDDLLNLHVYSSYALSAAGVFAPRSSATLQIDVFATAVSGGLGLASFEVGISHVPEPRAALLLTATLVSLWGRRRLGPRR